MMKNATPYLLKGQLPTDLNELLAKRPFVPCGSMDTDSCGYVPVMRVDETLAYKPSENSTVIRLQIETKNLPAAAVKDEVDYKVKAIEQAENRKVGRKEQREIKDRTAEEMLPKAFTQKSASTIYQMGDLLVSDASTIGNAEFSLSTLRETLGQLPTRLINTKISPVTAMTDWLTNGTPDGFDLLQSAELRHPSEGGAIARFKNQVLDCDEIKQHLAQGKVVTRLGLSWNDKIAFVLTDEFQLKSITQLDTLKDQYKDIEAETQDQVTAASLLLETGEMQLLLLDLIKVLGGLED